MYKDKDYGSELFYTLFSLVKPSKVKGNSTVDEWSTHVLPHSPIQELAPNLWEVTGTVPSPGFLPRNMIVYQLPESTLLIHSPIALNESTMKQLESLGKPRIMIVPNRIHRLDAPVYKQRYPELLAVAPEAAKVHVEKVVPVDAVAEEFLPNYGITFHQPEGIRPQELAYELQLPTGKALIFTDILFNLTESYLNRYSPRSKLILRWLQASGYFGITALGKRFFMNDRIAYCQWLEALASHVSPLQVICVAHGEAITTHCTEKLREAAARLS